MEDVDKLTPLSVARREFFGPGAPSKQTFEKWIARGTTEGVYLEGVVLDGKMYVRRRDVERFLTLSRVARADAERPPRRDKASERVAASLEFCRKMGIKNI